ncbi:MAG: hypothetical protein MUE46_10540 [Xanthomonadales bacterium]|jgi:hypothetical protein|nr:hypothetical protein [Xanthomonadales bacterium]
MNPKRTPSPDPDGVRITPERAPLSKAALLALAGLAFTLALLYWPRPDTAAPATGTSLSPSGDVSAAEPRAVTRAAPAPPARIDPSSAVDASAPRLPDAIPAVPPRSAEANDIATHFRPGDEAPSAAELIQALRDAGETGGIAAFNPPGTSPPLSGLAVPADFPLPPGYVRHHQWTDAGEPVEAILMFAPDFVLHDADGREVPLPANRVVPPELAPPGLPIRPVEIPGE